MDLVGQMIGSNINQWGLFDLEACLSEQDSCNLFGNAAFENVKVRSSYIITLLLSG